MLVYSTYLELGQPARLDHYFSAVSRWVSRKGNATLSAKQVRGPTSRQFADSLSTRFESWIAASDGELLHSARLSHGDSSVAGRLWTTEVGLRAVVGEQSMTFTALVETREVSTLVQSRVDLHPPKVISELVTAFGLMANAPGATERFLTEQSAADLHAYEVLDPTRAHAILIISPTASGEYLVDSRKLRELAAGLADVWIIPPAADPWKISRRMTAIPAPYHGAITLIFPRRKMDARDFVPSRVLTAADLLSLRSAELHILEAVAHRFNLPTSWKHISPDRVRERLRTRSFQQLKDSLAAAPQAGVYDALFAKVAEDEEVLRRQLSQTEAERDSFWYQFEEAGDQIRRMKYENDQLEQQLSDAKATRKPGKGIPKELRSAVAGAVLHAPSVLSALSLIEQLFSDRLIVLPNARKAAKDHDRFQFGADAFAVMFKLADDYWAALAAGVPDADARKVFGQHEFAAKEAGLSKAGRRARTFEVPARGAMLFEPHLKIQRGPNDAESWRCHFEWLADTKQIVIGHCGVHLPM